MENQINCPKCSTLLTLTKESSLKCEKCHIEYGPKSKVYAELISASSLSREPEIDSKTLSAFAIESVENDSGANPIPAEQGQTADLTGIQFNVPKASNWATLYRVCGWLLLVLGIIGTIGTAQENGEAGFTFAVIAITLVLTCFLSAFLIDVLTDMRHYQKQSAECLQKLLEKG